MLQMGKFDASVSSDAIDKQQVLCMFKRHHRHMSKLFVGVLRGVCSHRGIGTCESLVCVGDCVE